MTVAAFIDSLKSQPLLFVPEDSRPGYISMALDAMEIWNNNACKGYALMAAESIGLDQHQISNLIDSIDWYIFNKTLEDAEKHYAQSEI